MQITFVQNLKAVVLYKFTIDLLILYVIFVCALGFGARARARTRRKPGAQCSCSCSAETWCSVLVLGGPVLEHVLVLGENLVLGARARYRAPNARALPSLIIILLNISLYKYLFT